MAYTEALPSSFKFNATETVDTVFSKILVNNLFKDNTFKPGVTFTNKYNERGGQIYARRLGKTAATVKTALINLVMRLSLKRTKRLSRTVKSVGCTA